MQTLGKIWAGVENGLRKEEWGESWKIDSKEMKSDICASPDVCALATRPSFDLFSHCRISWNLTEISFPEFGNRLLNLIMNCDRARS